ncbi:flagellar motor protein MotB [Actimicrobium sp. CCI2.3]|uniref:flagellar motor protein MotB n=1 Tax=Actimicrobium sp. CCI2.3 TaxID=3048616 RepID=UPI002AB3317A|nr:flagellar motor protein MotB [Actimicrobium sp. CCI2.3]MDY7575358.1 flagellar motor protein MotB [Actimicrobium sp. CCI2.3]MEB0021270.1 flagellar motor protein MotB [Actimicrobium sp. CCI2.3]
MADEGTRPIIVKRIKKVAGGHHGGAWKIAYADFVTAMMAFFLLMWLLGSTAKGSLSGIAQYFQTPLTVAMGGGSGSGDSSSVIQGGGQDLTRKDGQVKRGETVAPKKTYNIKASQSDLEKALEKAEAGQLKALKVKIEALIESNPMLNKFKNQLLLDITSEGLRIQIIDEQNRPMFASAKAELQPYTKEILHEIGFALNDVPNRISLSGHTDASTYSSGEKGYSNWELSADRANASRKELIFGGMNESKVLRVVGLSSAVLYDKENPFNPINRRISIIVMNKKAEDAASREGARAVNVVSGDEDGAEVTTGPSDLTGSPAPAPARAPSPAATVPR